MKSKSIWCYLASFILLSLPSVGERQEWKGSFASTCYRFENFWGLKDWTPVNGSLRFAFQEGENENNAQIQLQYLGPFRYAENIEIEITLPTLKEMHIGSSFKFPVPTVSEEIIWKITEHDDGYISGTYDSISPPDAGTFTLRHTQHWSTQS